MRQILHIFEQLHFKTPDQSLQGKFWSYRSVLEKDEKRFGLYFGFVFFEIIFLSSQLVESVFSVTGANIEFSITIHRV